MKRWTIKIALVFIMFLTFNTTFAIDDLENETYEIPTDGKIEMHFNTAYSPVAGVVVQIYYNMNGTLVELKDVPQMELKDINLVSDENGIVVVSDLPYGMYRYEVLEIPEGFNLDNKTGKFVITNVIKNRVIEFSIDEIIVLDSVNETLEEPKENENIKPPIESKPGNTVVIGPTDKEPEQPIKIDEEVIQNNQEAVNTKLNELTKDIYNYDDTEEKVEKTKTNASKANVSLSVVVDNKEKLTKEQKEAVMKNTVINIRERMRKSNMDIISQFKKYRISDSVKIAINNADQTINEHLKMVSDLPNNDKNKKIKKSSRTIIKGLNSSKERKGYTLTRKNLLLK